MLLYNRPVHPGDRRQFLTMLGQRVCARENRPYPTCSDIAASRSALNQHKEVNVSLASALVVLLVDF